MLRSRFTICVAVSAQLSCATSEDTPKDDVSTGVTLEAPPPGEGFQLTTGEFEVAPGTDQQDCHFFQIPGDSGTKVHVNRIVVAQNEGSHHMNVFRVRTVVDLGPEGGRVQRSTNGEGACFDSSNWADWPLVTNSQLAGQLESVLPDGVAHTFDAGEWLMLQTHYVNASTQRTPTVGKVLVNFHTVDATRVRHELGTLFATKQNIRICRSDTRSHFEGSCQFNSTEPIHVVGANAHFHSRGREFKIWQWDGLTTTTPSDDDTFYLSDSWDDPPMVRFPELDRVVEPGGGLWYACDFEWTPPPAPITCDQLDEKDAHQLGTPPNALDCCYTFGGPVDWAEHCNVFAYYYPKSDDINCF